MIIHRAVGVALVSLVAAWHPPSAAAQVAITGGAAAEVTLARVERRLTADTVALSGATFGVAGDLDIGPARLGLGYRQGAIESEDAVSSADLVEGYAALTVRPFASVRVGLIGDARAYLTDAGTERWLRWSGLIGAEARLTPAIRSFLEIAIAFAGSTNVGTSLASGRGATGGVVARLPGSPITVSAGYRVDWGELSAGGRSDVVEGAYLAIGIGRGR
jgi:hypothetical protein